MPDAKPSRRYEERFLDGYGRSRLREEVQKVRPKSSLRRRYATWALGASLALGGLGVPMKIVKSATGTGGTRAASSSSAQTGSQSSIESDLETAKSIAAEVAGGVQAAAQSVQQVASAPLQTVAETPQKLVVVSEQVREQFFKTEVPFGSIIYKEAKKNNVSPELVAAVVQAESRFKPTARSHAGAVGLMQLVPRTGKWMGARDLTNPAQNIQAGTKYLRYLSDRFNGNETKIIAAYNAGEGNVRRFGGIPPFKETRNYVKKVRNYQADYGERIDNRLSEAAPETQAAR